MPNLHELENAMPVAPLKIIALQMCIRDSSPAGCSLSEVEEQYFFPSSHSSYPMFALNMTLL